jgi:error-prone DNA polymerase
VGFRNPPVPWSDLERRLSDRLDDPLAAAPRHGRFPGDGGDSPAWSRRRLPYEAPTAERAVEGSRRSGTPYAELHCHSNFSFLDGASSPEQLAEEAARLGLEALAVTDHDSFSGVVRFAEAARALSLPTVFGAELTLGRTGVPVGAADPGRATDRADAPLTERHLVVLARDPRGYALLSRAISEAQLAGEKGAPRTSVAALSALAGPSAHPADRGRWLVLTGCRKGAVPHALVEHGPGAAADELARLVDAFGREHVAVELWDHGHPLDSHRNDALAEVAVRAGVDLVATNGVHYASPAQRPLATALAAVRARRSLDEIEGWLPAGATAHLRSGAEQARRFARYPGVVERAAELGRACAFDLSLVAPNLPPFPCPPGHTEMSWLRELTERGATRRYGARPSPTNPTERVRGAYEQIDHELRIIEALGFPGYFLVVWDIVEFCVRSDILCQGRGSAANSAVCFALGITKADAVSLGLLFERFLSPERDGPPDIDIDIESGRREEVIQYVYATHGREHAAQVCNVISYRSRSAVRDMAKALGYAPGQQDAWAKQVDRWGSVSTLLAERQERDALAARLEGVRRRAGEGTGEPAGDDIPRPVLELAAQVEHAPRHLGIHSGGMVICDRPVVEVCPVEWARMENRSVLQWDKDDCAAVGLVKFDLLGLGMLSAIHLTLDLVAEHHGTTIDLAGLPQEDAVYDMVCRADTIGVFQIESRAQMATLPRLRPRTFYDLVVEVALIRPGPIQGGSVHPYIRRRNGQEPVTYLHPLLERSLSKTLGIPLFQEQLMQMAIDVAGFSAGEADQLRQAMGSKRSAERMERLRARLYEGMAERGITGEVADQIYEKLAAFANFGFPESHSVSFAYLVYASSWLKLHYPAAFCAALVNSQPMGFYSPHTLAQDARRHGVEIRTPDLARSGAAATLEWDELGWGADDTGGWPGPHPVGKVGERPDAAGRFPVDPAVTGPQPAVRLGLASVRHIGDDLAERIEADRTERGPFVSMEDLKRRVGLTLPALEGLATAGAFACFDHPDGTPLDRRRALWAAGAVAQSAADRLPGVVVGADAPQLPGMSDDELARADLWASGVSPDGHPTRFLRPQLDAMGVVPAAALAGRADGSKVLVGGVVTHRQRPATAGGTTFLNLEDETGLVNVIVSKGCWLRYGTAARGAPALVIRGRLDTVEGVVNVIAEKIDPLTLGAQPSELRSRDFR